MLYTVFVGFPNQGEGKATFREKGANCYLYLGCWSWPHRFHYKKIQVLLWIHPCGLESSK